MITDVSGWRVHLDDKSVALNTESGAWQNRTIADDAFEIARRNPDRITHVFENRRFCISELLRDAQSLACSLFARGFRAGDVVAFQLPNWSEAVVIDLTAAMLGLVVAPIVPIYRDAELLFMLSDSRAKAVFVPEEYRGFNYAAMMTRIAPRLPCLKLISVVRSMTRDLDNYESLLTGPETLASLPLVDPNSVKMVLYTSGTTGSPKGVLHSHNTLSHAVRQEMAYWSQGDGDTILMASPVTHVTGFATGMEPPFLCGMRTVFMERWDAAVAVKLVDDEQVTLSMGATPFLHELLIEAIKQGSALPSLRIFACGGAAVPSELIKRAHVVLKQCRAFRMYGSSEVPSTTLGFIQSDQAEKAATTDGKIVYYDVRILDDTGQSVPIGVEGEICVRGASMFLGYTDWLQTEASLDSSGYFHSGDLGRIDSSGALLVTGRKKDLINRGGEKLSAKEIEDILHLHPSIEEAAVVAMPHARLGETVCAYVILKRDRVLTFEDLVSHVASSGIAKQKYPEHLVIVDSLPRTASGKIRKDELRTDIRTRLGSGP